MNVILFDTPTTRGNLLPFTFTRPVADIRIGILKISEKWEKRLETSVSFIVPEYLKTKFPANYQETNLYISGHLCPTQELIDEILNLENGEGLEYDGKLIALKSNEKFEYGQNIRANALKESHSTFNEVNYYYDIYIKNKAEIKVDYDLVTKGRKSEIVKDLHTIVYGDQNIFIEEGVKIRAAIINAEDGPIYIGKNVQIHEGAIVRGSCAILENSHVNPGAKLRGDSTIGPFCKVGGEISNSVVFGYSNKGHDGFLGNSVLGEWCNLGADTNTSNLKNNYSEIKCWNYLRETFAVTGQQFLGLMMGDHTKCGINTMFNTGTIVGVFANIFGAGYPRKFIPSFAWGGGKGFETTRLEESFDIAERVMERRNVKLSDVDREIITFIKEETIKYRRWER